MSEEQKDQTVQTKQELLNALEKEFATSVNKVYVNSLDREFSFSEISVKDQKSLTRIMSANEHRKDIVYDAQCAIINKAALDKDFDVYKLTEFDRLKLLISLYQENMFQNEVKFTCEECGAENKYKVNFKNTIQKLDAYKLEDKTFNYENKNFKYKFELSYPTVKLVSQFHQSYNQIHNGAVPRREMKSNEILVNLEYINLFIKSIDIENKNTGSTKSIAFSNYKVSDIEDILSAFPQDVLYTENGVLKFIVNEYLKYVNDAFDKHECWNCHTIHEKGTADHSGSFF